MDRGLNDRRGQPDRHHRPRRRGSVPNGRRHAGTLWRRRPPAMVVGGFDWVDVRDVVAGMHAAAERGRVGQNYILSGHRRPISELARLAGACSGIAVTRRTAPSWSASLCSPLGTIVARATGYPLLPTREGLHTLRAFSCVDGTKAARELGYQPRPIEQTVADLYAFFRQTGALTADQQSRRQDRLHPRGSAGYGPDLVQGGADAGFRAAGRGHAHRGPAFHSRRG